MIVKRAFGFKQYMFDDAIKDSQPFHFRQ